MTKNRRVLAKWVESLMSSRTHRWTDNAYLLIRREPVTLEQAQAHRILAHPTGSVVQLGKDGPRGGQGEAVYWRPNDLAKMQDRYNMTWHLVIRSVSNRIPERGDDDETI